MKYLKPFALTAIATTLAACGGDDDNDKAYLRVLHASPDAPAVDVLINGNAVLESVSFQQGSGYLEIDDGNTTVELRVSGTDTIALSTDVDLDDDGYYSAIAVNEVASLDLKLIDDTATFGDDDADVTVVHAATAAPGVDIFVTAPGAALGAPTLNAVPYKADAALEGVAAGDYQVRISVDENDQLVYNSGTVSVGGDLTLVAVNSTKGTSPVSLIAWGDTGTSVVLDFSAEVRVVHAVDAIDVDIFANGELLLDGFSYKDDSGYVTVDPGTLSVAIAADDQGIGNALPNLSGDLSLERGESYTVIASGDTGSVTDAELIVLADTRAPADGNKAYVRLVHASSASAADPVDIFVYLNDAMQPAEPTLSDIVQGQDSGYLTLAPATYIVDIAADGTTSPAISGLDALVFAGGDVKTAIAVGNGSGLEALVLDDSRAD
jgi:hypothetical protein